MALLYDKDYILAQLRAGYADLLDDNGEMVIGGSLTELEFDPATSYQGLVSGLSIKVSDPSVSPTRIGDQPDTSYERDPLTADNASIASSLSARSTNSVLTSSTLSPRSPSTLLDARPVSEDAPPSESSQSLQAAGQRISTGDTIDTTPDDQAGEPRSRRNQSQQQGQFFIGSYSVHSDEYDSDSDLEFGDTTIPNLSVPSQRSMALSEHLYELNMDDDSDFEENLLLVAQPVLAATDGTASAAAATLPDIAQSFRQNRRSTTSLRGLRPMNRRKSTLTDLDTAREQDESMLPAENGHTRQRSQSEADKTLGAFTQPLAHELRFSKRAVEVANPGGPGAPSHLAQMISGKGAELDDPLDSFKSTGFDPSSREKPLRLSVYMPSSTDPRVPWECVVQRTSTVHSAIGYALFRFRESGRGPALAGPLLSANQWNLRLAEDDGEPDEDFPALERTRPVASYSVDEVALVRATATEAHENDRVTPIKLRKLPAQRSLSGMSSPQVFPASVTVRVFRYPYDALLSSVYWETTDLGIETRIETILEAICAKNSLDAASHVLRLAESRAVIDLSTSISDLEDDIRHPPTDDPSRRGERFLLLELVSKRLLKESLNPSALMARPSPTIGQESDATEASNTTLKAPGITYQSLGYYKYRVWRRQQMSFMGRHERDLVIDGEYVHIMPSSDRSLIDAPKTTSFHLRQIIKAKTSSKVPTYVKIFVMKQSGPKRYDLEAVSIDEATEIVERIKRLRGK